MRNRMVIGLDYFHRSSQDFSSGYPWFYDVTPQGEIDYTDPYTGETVPDRFLTRQSLDAVLASSPRSNRNTNAATYSVYFSAVVNFTHQFLAMFSLQIGSAHVSTPVTTSQLVSSLLIEQKKID